MTQKNKIIFEYSKCDIVYKLWKASAIFCNRNKNIFNTCVVRADDRTEMSQISNCHDYLESPWEMHSNKYNHA